MHILELFCGIGGCAAALAGRGRVVAAIDIKADALETYTHNFPHPTLTRTIESLRAPDYRGWDADLWWLSPPCQPFTERGLRRDAEDPRARPFLAVIQRLEEMRPGCIALENVPGFAGSTVHSRLRAALEQAGYEDVHERLLCPSEMGIPNRRRRYYLVASRRRLLPFPELTPTARPLRDFLDSEPHPELAVEPELLERYEGALHVVDADDPSALTTCFTSAYGRSPVRSGSYLRTEDGVRRFSPAEILRLLGFPGNFALPPELPPEKAWPLVGNSLSLEPVRAMIATIPDLI